MRRQVLIVSQAWPSICDAAIDRLGVGPFSQGVDLTLFVVGVAFMIAGTAMAIKELVIALEPIKAGKRTLNEVAPNPAGRGYRLVS
jgi:hypothetical protein